jgi:hypothetical protein
LKLAGAYLLAAFLHGLWNALSILTGLAGALNNPSTSLSPLIKLSRLAPVGLGLLVLLLFALLLGFNRHLQHQYHSQLASSTAGQPVESETRPEASNSSQSS